MSAKWYDGKQVGDKLFQFKGPVSGYDFQHQQANFDRLVEILEQAGMEFSGIDVTTRVGHGAYNSPSKFAKLTTFVAWVGNDRENSCFYWHKYEGMTAGGGQNEVVVNGSRMKLSEFLRMDELRRFVMLTDKQPATKRKAKARSK